MRDRAFGIAVTGHEVVGISKTTEVGLLAVCPIVLHGKVRIVRHMFHVREM